MKASPLAKQMINAGLKPTTVPAPSPRDPAATRDEIISVLAEEADRAAAGSGWSFLLLQRMALCAQALRDRQA